MAATKKLILAFAPSLGLVLSLGASPDPEACAKRRDLGKEPTASGQSEGTAGRSVRR